MQPTCTQLRFFPQGKQSSEYRWVATSVFWDLNDFCVGQNKFDIYEVKVV